MTSYSVSDSFYTRTKERPFQGLIQGNGTILPGFLLIAVFLIRALYRANLIPLSESPISKVIYYLAGQIFVDDSDFNTMNNGKEDKEMIIKRTQDTLNE